MTTGRRLSESCWTATGTVAERAGACVPFPDWPLKVATTVISNPIQISIRISQPPNRCSISLHGSFHGVPRYTSDADAVIWLGGTGKSEHDYAFSKPIPNPLARGLMPSMRTPFIRPCGVEETTGTLVSFSSGTIKSSVLNAPQEMTSASAFFDLA